MKIINSTEELKKRKADIHDRMNSNEKLRLKVHMGTSGQASGAREIFDFLKMELEKRNIDALVTGTGDLGYSFAVPTIEVKLPKNSPVVFGNVDKLKADEIIEKYIKNGDLVDGILPVNYQVIR
jgi:NADP-reducing hydrogenase subunit HndB